MAQPSLSVGKLDPSVLRNLVFNCLGVTDSRVILGPSIGEDASVIDFGDRVLVIHSDPITGAVKNVGWLAVNVAANDIATRGVKPAWMLIVLLLPSSMDSRELEHIFRQIDEAAKELGIAIVGGHSEVTVDINRPVVIATALGETKKGEFVQSSGARVGDRVIITKGAAIEGTAILSTELAGSLQRQIDSRLIRNAQNFIKKISVVKDALTAVEVGGVHAMHDATEGGVAAGLQEIAWASNVGIVTYEKKIPIYRETELICQSLKIDPLKTIGSGALVISAHPDKAEEIVTALRENGIRSSVVGKILEKSQGCYIVRKDGTKLDLTEPAKEELWRVVGEQVANY